MNGTSRTVTKEIFKELSFTSLKTQCCQNRRWGHLFSSVQQEHHSHLPRQEMHPQYPSQTHSAEAVDGGAKNMGCKKGVGLLSQFKLGSFCHGKSAKKDKFLWRGSQGTTMSKAGLCGCPTSAIKCITRVYCEAFPPTSILSQQEQNKILISTSCT